MSQTLSVAEAVLLAESWQIALRAERKSPQTLKAYGDGVRQYLAWCLEREAAPLSRASLNLWVAQLLDTGSAAATARSRQLAVRRFSAWLTEEGESEADPFLGVKAPKLDEQVIEPLSDDELRRLLKACVPPRGVEPKVALRYRRDEAIIRLMFETGMRAGETVALAVTDVALTTNTATVRRGKGGKGRSVPFGAESALALDRYLRLRRGHRLAASPALWLGDRGKGFSYDALHKTLKERANAAGIEGFHPHRLRHTAAHRWLAAGGISDHPRGCCRRPPGATTSRRLEHPDDQHRRRGIVDLDGWLRVPDMPMSVDRRTVAPRRGRPTLTNGRSSARAGSALSEHLRT